MSTIKADAITASTGTNTNIGITGKGTGKVVLGDGSLIFPDADGAAGTAIVTNGSGTLSFSAAGKLVQVVNTQTGAVATGTTQIVLDDTIPQKTEGTEFMTLAITPTNASNTLLIDTVAAFHRNTAGRPICWALFQDTTAGALAAGKEYDNQADTECFVFMRHKMTAGTTSATTFKLRAGASGANTLTFNGRGGTRVFGGVCASSITITEISA